MKSIILFMLLILSNSLAPKLLLTEIVKGDTGLYLDNTLTYAFYEDFVKDIFAGYSAIGNMEGMDVKISNKIATLNTTEIWHGWHGASLAQVPPTSNTNSYFSFADVEKIVFKIKSTDISPKDIKFFMQSIVPGTGNYLEKSISELGGTDISDWTQITVPVASYKTTKIKVAIALSVMNGALYRKIQVKEIGFINSKGENANIISTISWPKDTGSSSGPESEMAIGTTLKKNGISLTLKWSDEFTEESKTPDKTKWGYDVGNGLSENSDGTYTNNLDWGNSEAQWYTNSETKNAYVSDGTLKIKAIREKIETKDWSSARLVTRNLKEFKYGYFEFRVKLPEAQGFWPAIWMLRHDIYDKNGTPWPTGGEIDILESSTNIWGTGKVYGTLHCDAGHSGNPIYTNGKQLIDIEKKWHLYGIYWAKDSISWYYDDQLVGKYKPSSIENNAVWPYDEDFYIIMNLAVGGNLGGNIPNTVKEAIMEIDYVRYFEASGEGNEGDNADPDQHKEDDIDVNYEIDESLKSPIGLVVSEKTEGVVDIVWGNDPTIGADIYVIYVDNKKVAESALPKVVSVVVESNGDHVFGVAAIVNGKSSPQTTQTVNIKNAK